MVFRKNGTDDEEEEEELEEGKFETGDVDGLDI